MKKIKKQTPPIPPVNINTRTEEEVLINSFKSWNVERVKANKFRILKRERIDGRTAYRFQYKTFFVWRDLKDDSKYYPEVIIIYLNSIKEAALFLQCHFGYGTVIETKFYTL